MHRVLGHASPEVISHVESASTDLKVDNSDPPPQSINRETCSTTKAIQIISRRSEVEQPENGTPFNRSTWDMMEFTTGYNGNRYASHFQYRKYLFNLVYTHAKKSDTKYLFESALSVIQGQFGGKVQFLRLDGETSLGDYFKDLVIEKQIKPEHSASYTPAQNEGAERSGRVLTTKAQAMQVAAYFPADLWPEIIKAAGYLSNRTPVRKLGWKTPFEAVTQVKPHFAHLHVYGSRAYPLIPNIPKTLKLNPRTYISYLVGYDSINIYRVWVPS
jgi:hypothetical protein